MVVNSGDHDMTIPYVATQAWIRSLNYSITEKWRPWMILDKVAGYTKTYANKMTFATVKVTSLLHIFPNVINAEFCFLIWYVGLVYIGRWAHVGV